LPWRIHRRRVRGKVFTGRCSCHLSAARCEVGRCSVLRLRVSARRGGHLPLHARGGRQRHLCFPRTPHLFSTPTRTLLALLIWRDTQGDRFAAVGGTARRIRLLLARSPGVLEFRFGPIYSDYPQMAAMLWFRRNRLLIMAPWMIRTSVEVESCGSARKRVLPNPPSILLPEDGYSNVSPEPWRHHYREIPPRYHRRETATGHHRRVSFY